jgi:hypothetical protein
MPFLKTEVLALTFLYTVKCLIYASYFLLSVSSLQFASHTYLFTEHYEHDYEIQKRINEWFFRTFLTKQKSTLLWTMRNCG